MPMILFSSKVTSEFPLVLSFPGHLSEKFLSVISLLTQSAALQGINRKNK